MINLSRFSLREKIAFLFVMVLPGVYAASLFMMPLAFMSAMDGGEESVSIVAKIILYPFIFIATKGFFYAAGSFVLGVILLLPSLYSTKKK